MTSLALAIFSSASIAWLFKISEGPIGGKMNRFRVTTTNYFVAFLVSLMIFISQNSAMSFTDKVKYVDWQSILLVGIPAGVCFFLSFIFYQVSVKENGASLSGMFGKLGILVPMLVSIFLWKELPSLLQSLGILLAMAAMIVVNLPEKGTVVNKIRASLLLLFVFGGLAEFSSKLFQKMGQPSDKPAFLFVVFFVAFLFSLIMTLYSSKSEDSILFKDLLMGVAVGVPNLLSSFFLISALNELPATVVFPVYSASAIGLISIGSALFFKEKLTKKSWIGILVTMIALVLVNI